MLYDIVVRCVVSITGLVTFILQISSCTFSVIKCILDYDTYHYVNISFFCVTEDDVDEGFLSSVALSISSMGAYVTDSASAGAMLGVKDAEQTEDLSSS